MEHTSSSIRIRDQYHLIHHLYRTKNNRINYVVCLIGSSSLVNGFSLEPNIFIHNTMQKESTTSLCLLSSSLS